MNQTEMNKYRAILEARQAELSVGLRNREDIAIEKTPDALDEVQLAGEREPPAQCEGCAGADCRWQLWRLPALR